MQATGLLFLNKTRPLATTAADGTFQLTLFAIDRIGPHRIEPWAVRWTGPAAQAFWQAHRQQLTPGTPIRVTTSRFRSFVQRGLQPEIHASADLVELAPPRSGTCADDAQAANDHTATRAAIAA